MEIKPRVVSLLEAKRQIDAYAIGIGYAEKESAWYVDHPEPGMKSGRNWKMERLRHKLLAPTCKKKLSDASKAITQIQTSMRPEDYSALSGQAKMLGLPSSVVSVLDTQSDAIKKKIKSVESAVRAVERLGIGYRLSPWSMSKDKQMGRLDSDYRTLTTAWSQTTRIAWNAEALYDRDAYMAMMEYRLSDKLSPKDKMKKMGEMLSVGDPAYSAYKRVADFVSLGRRASKEPERVNDTEKKVLPLAESYLTKAFEVKKLQAFRAYVLEMGKTRSVDFTVIESIDKQIKKMQEEKNKAKEKFHDQERKTAGKYGVILPGEVDELKAAKEASEKREKDLAEKAKRRDYIDVEHEARDEEERSREASKNDPEPHHFEDEWEKDEKKHSMLPDHPDGPYIPKKADEPLPTAPKRVSPPNLHEDTDGWSL